MKTFFKNLSVAALAVVLTIATFLLINPKVSIGQGGQGTTIRNYVSLIACNAALNHQLIHVTGAGLFLCDMSGNPGIWGPLTTANQIPAAYGQCEILDFAVCESTTSSGNPFFITAGSAGDLTIGGTGMILVVNGQYQTGTGTYTNAITGLSASNYYYVYVKEDVANANFVAADFAATNLAPIYSYIAPTACTGATSTNPQYWFDMTQRAWQSSTAAACSFSVSSPQVLFLGVAHMNGSNAMDQVAHEPYNLSPYKRMELFGDGMDSINGGTDIVKQEKTTGTTVINGWHMYTSFELTAATINPTTGASGGTADGTIIIYSQNPVLLINSSSYTATALGRVGALGQTGVGSTASNAGYAGSGGSGGGGGSSAGGPGGGRQSYFNNNSNAGQAAGGAVNTNGNNGTGTPTNQYPFCNTAGVGLVGGTGGGGGGDGTHAGGNGGGAGGGMMLKAPSILVDASSLFTANGANGAAGSAPNSGGGGGAGGGSVIACGGFLAIAGTFTANAGTGGAGSGTGGTGGNGSIGQIQKVKLW